MSKPLAQDQDPNTPPVSLETLWKKIGFKPNEKQERAIRAISGPLYLTAGPGSGKTSVLVWRTLNLIVRHAVSPEKIFLGTFTEKGAHQLRERLRDVLTLATQETGRPYDISRMAIGTIHSICHRLLTDRRLSGTGARPHAPVLLDEFDQYQLIYASKNWSRLVEASGLGENAEAQITDFFEGRPSTSRHRAVVNAMGFFNRMSEESLDLTPKRPQGMVGALLKMYMAYRALLEEDPRRTLTDFSLVQTHAYRRIAASPDTDNLFKHVIVDEYQDTNVIQEKIYFCLARHSRNLCVVGDDDQALYRFRGATVDNFLAFPDRCMTHLGVKAQRIPLETNYRSRRGIVDFYNAFMGEFQWRRGKRTFRVPKTILANNTDSQPAVFSTAPDAPEVVAAEVAEVVKRLLDTKRVRDASQIAFLFPSLQSACVPRMKAALETVGLKVYAPRAGSFMEQPESLKVFGVYLHIFGNPGHRYQEYDQWLKQAEQEGAKLLRDPLLAKLVKEKQQQIAQVVQDEGRLLQQIATLGRSEEDACSEADAAALSTTEGVSQKVRRFLRSPRLVNYLSEQKRRRPDRPITFRYVLNRACLLDWGVLDLFYELTRFDAFKQAFDLAENGDDEGPICNMSLLSDYLARFQQQTSPVISARFLSEQRFSRKLFSSFLYSLFRLDEGEYEDKEDPFPKGRIPFLTVHQAKGLEFPVVVLGNLRKDSRKRDLDTVVAELGAVRLEPAELAPTYDVARMFYVALSRAKQALILCPFKGRGQSYRDEFKGPIQRLAAPLSSLRMKSIEPSAEFDDTAPHPYSFTGDYLQYQICPRRYMLYRRYKLVPSRSQTTIFGNLVHRTIEDLHQLLISSRGGPGTASGTGSRS